MILRLSKVYPTASHLHCPRLHALTPVPQGVRRRRAALVCKSSLKEELESDIKRTANDLERAVQTEDYKAASLLKQHLDQLELERLNSNPLLFLQTQLQNAVKEERYKDAASIKAQIQALERESQAAASSSTSTAKAVSTMSDTVTHGIRIRVRSFYQPGQSMPSRSYYFFGYHVQISNESDRVVQLRNRHWVIEDEEGRTEEVRGPGCVGKQPVLLPGNGFEYSSGCPLNCKTGYMSGEIQFAVLDETDGRFNNMVDALVSGFKLSAEVGG
uniref:ApaG domain-containing protein n=2 Tax=Dunaliella tertiolecta TaxID=3047 RepID=A0A6S8JEK1_DUNTE